MTYHSGNELINPQTLFEKAQLRSGMHIADFGCGRTGHIIFPASLVIGERGIIYAVDILKDVLQSIHKRADLENLSNIQTVWADLERPLGVAIPEKTLDVIFMVNVLFHFKNYEATLNEAVRLLKTKSRILIVDWVNRLGGLGPKDGDMVDFNKIIFWARKAGFAVQEDFNLSRYHRSLVLFRNS